MERYPVQALHKTVSPFWAADQHQQTGAQLFTVLESMAKGQGCTLQIPLSALQPWSRGTRQHGCRNTVRGKRLFAELCEGQSSEQQLRPWYPGMTRPHAPECQVQRPDRTTYPLQALQQMKLTKRTLIHFFSHFLPSFLLLLPLSVSGGPVWKKLSFYDAISGTR